MAARVTTVARMLKGDAFPDAFSRLVETHGFEVESAFSLVMRIYRGGGLTKDAIYLRGLVEALAHFRDAADLETLWAGKMGRDHLPMIRELLFRGILSPAALTPRFLSFPTSKKRLAKLRETRAVLNLIQPSD